MNEKLNFNVFLNAIFFKNCTDCTDFFLKMYGFVQKSFGHPVFAQELDDFFIRSTLAREGIWR